MGDSFPQLSHSDPLQAIAMMAVAVLIYLLVGLVPVCGISYGIYFLLTLPMRRNERARLFLRGDHFAAMLLDNRIERRAFGDFLVRQDRIELFGVQVVVDDFMPGRFEFLNRRGGDGVAETARLLVADQDEDVHGGRD